MGPVAADGDCDGVLTVDDCDDTDPSVTRDVGDPDCDGVMDIVIFLKGASADPADPANQDCISANVCVTRGTDSGLYNAVSESGFTAGTSPADVEFAAGNVGQALTYTDWDTSIRSWSWWVLQPMSMHLVTDDLYFNLVDFYWTNDSGSGGFGTARAGVTSFQKTDFADPADPANQDCLMPGVCLTRADDLSIYNAVSETAYVPGVSSAATVQTDYVTWTVAIGPLPTLWTNQTVSIWLPNEERVFDLVLLRWPEGASGGGFTYVHRDAAQDVVCGNGVLQAIEECDDGNTTDADGCQGDCRLPYCGDNIQDPTEECDEGLANSSDSGATCRPGCTLAGCGDGILDPAEVCDDGNTVDGDGCEGDCSISCGAGTDAALAVLRDRDGKCLLAFDTKTTQPAAQANCLALGGNLTTVGDAADNAMLFSWAVVLGTQIWIGFSDVMVEGTFEWLSGEASTYTHWAAGHPTNVSGNEDCAWLRNADGLWKSQLCGRGRSYVCETLCGNGVVDPGELCDQGPDNSDAAGSACRNNCQVAPACGDGILDVGEHCDDGNNIDGDGCEGDCRLVCGFWTGALFAIESPTDGACFLLLPGRFDCIAAEGECQRIGGHLLTIADANENAILAPFKLQAATNPLIGFNDLAVEDDWQWTSGDPVTYTNWRAGQPKSADSTQLIEDVTWKVSLASDLRPVICEIP